MCFFLHTYDWYLSITLFASHVKFLFSTNNMILVYLFRNYKLVVKSNQHRLRTQIGIVCSKSVLYIPNRYYMFQLGFACSKSVLYVPNGVYGVSGSLKGDRQHSSTVFIFISIRFSFENESGRTDTIVIISIVLYLLLLLFLFTM